MHATYAISPNLLNETSFNYNGNRINIVPFAGSGLSSLALPAGYDATNSRLFTGPNNDNRIPNIDLNGSTGTHFEISSWPWHNKADDYQIRDDVSLDQGGAPAEDSAEAGRSTRRCRTCSAKRKARSTSTAPSPAMTSPTSFSATPRATTNSQCKTTASGTTFRGPHTFRTTGA